MPWWTKAKLKSQSAETRLQAVYELSQMHGADAAECLADRLKDKDWGVQKLAAKALVTRGDSRGLSFLIEMLGTRADAEVEDFLSAVGDAAIGPLVAALTSPNSRVSHTVSALKRLRWTPESPAHRAIFAVGEGRYEEAATFGSPAVDPLIAALRERHTATEGIVKALGDTGDPRCVGPLIQVLGSESAPERAAAIKALQESAWELSPDWWKP
jgi:HEAT repeat protein